MPRLSELQYPGLLSRYDLVRFGSVSSLPVGPCTQLGFQGICDVHEQIVYNVLQPTQPWTPKKMLMHLHMSRVAVHLDLTQLLLDHGVDVNMQGGHYGKEYIQV